MRVADLLNPSLLAVPAPWRTFDDTVTGLVRLVGAEQSLDDAATRAAIAAVIDREATASTALLEIGVGIPHARLAGLSRPWLAIAVAPAGLYEPVPMLRLGIVALLLSPLSAVELHLQTLASLSVLFRSTALRSALLGAPDPTAAFAAIALHDRDAR